MRVVGEVYGRDGCRIRNLRSIRGLLDSVGARPGVSDRRLNRAAGAPRAAALARPASVLRLAPESDRFELLESRTPTRGLASASRSERWHCPPEVSGRLPRPAAPELRNLFPWSSVSRALPLALGLPDPPLHSSDWQ